MLGRTIRTLLEVRQETEVHFLVGTVMLGFLSIFKKSQASSRFEAFNSVCLSRCQSMWIPLSTWDGDIRLSLGSPHGIQTSLHLVRWKTSLNLSHWREIRLSFESGPLTVHSTWDRIPRSLSHTYCWGKTPLEVLVERWLKSSVKDRESALSFRWYGVHGALLELLYWN